MCQCFRHSHSLSRSECFFFVPVLVEVTLHPLRHDLIFPAVFLLESNFLSLFQIAAPEVHHLRDLERRKRQNRVIICISSKVSQIKSQKTSDFTSLDGSNHVPLVMFTEGNKARWIDGITPECMQHVKTRNTSSCRCRLSDGDVTLVFRGGWLSIAINMKHCCLADMVQQALVVVNMACEGLLTWASWKLLVNANSCRICFFAGEKRYNLKARVLKTKN